MKKLFFIILLLGLFVLNVQAQTEEISGERIDNFVGKININADASIDITEKIYYNFDTLERHGIYRDIPVEYKARGGNYKLIISDISVTDESGRAYTYKKSKDGSNVRIKIGDADKYVTGQKTYIIHYKIKRAINYFDDHDELYWNFIGSDWDVTIHKASVSVILPSTVAADELQSECFEGRPGSTSRCLNSVSPDGTLDYDSQGKIYSGQAMTIVAGFPKNIVKKPSTGEALWEIVKDNWVVFMPIIVFAAMFYLWYTRGRDPKGRGTIVAQYEAPDKLTPLETGTVFDERAGDKDISAEIINLAVQGFLKIKKIEGKDNDYEFEKLNSNYENLTEYDKSLLEGIFGKKSKVNLSDLKNKFHEKLTQITEDAYNSVVSKQYFQKNPSTVRTIYISISVLIIVASFFTGGLWGGIGIISLVFSGALVGIFGFFMPKKTLKGVAAQEHILGLKQYLAVAEKDRIKFHNAPAKNPAQFEKLLPYAMVLGVEKEWAKQFEDIYKQSPSWYEDSSGHQFSALLLANSLHSFSSNAYSSLSSMPPSSASHGGSGFSGGGSGGGFGGGGGGSW
jgi:uncharacterized membrane protein